MREHNLECTSIYTFYTGDVHGKYGSSSHRSWKYGHEENNVYIIVAITFVLKIIYII